MAEEKEPIRSLTGATHDGQPLSFGRAPVATLRPWFSRISVSEVMLPEGRSLACGMLNDHPMLRVLFGGRWRATTADGTFDYDPGALGMTLMFGPHSHRMPLEVFGSFRIVTLYIAAGASAAFDAPDPAETLDRILDYDELVGHGRLSARFDPGASADEWIEALEHELLRLVKRVDPPPPDPLAVAFETAVLADPGIAVADFAARQGVTRRTLERTIRRHFGLTPKQVLRRARALDMAAMLLGVALAEEESEMRLRYSDESHLIREIRHFFAMTPGQLRTGAHPLLRITVEMRQQRRLDALHRMRDGDPGPWRDPQAEPKA